MATQINQRNLFSQLDNAFAQDKSALTVVLGRKYTSLFPENGVAWMMYGTALIETAQYADARKAIMKSIRLCPKDKLKIPLAQLGHLYDRKGNLDAAANWFRKTIDASPKDATGYIYLGSVLARQGKLTEAVRCHRRATGCKHHCVDEAYLNLGLVLRAQGKFRQAQTALKNAIKLSSDYTEAKDALEDVKRALRYTTSQRTGGKRAHSS